MHQARKTVKVGGIAAFLHESLTFNIRNDSSVTKALCVEVINRKSKPNDYQSTKTEKDEKDRDFVNLILQGSLVPIVKKPFRVTKNNTTLIDYVITNSFTDQEDLTGILKIDISDNFPIFTISMKHRLYSSNKQ